MTPDKYLDENGLWDLEQLKIHAQSKHVYVIQSERIPNVVMLHYMDVVQYDNLWNTFNRMCRGLILDLKNRQILAYPFSKFFNLGQMPETNYESLSTLGGFQTSEKLDGSMIIGFINPNDTDQRENPKVTFTTKGSFDSEHGAYANALQFTDIQKLRLRKYAYNGTLMFELITKRFQIVVDYSKKGYPEGLYLIGYRFHETNRLAEFAELETIAADLELPRFKTYQFNGLDQLINAAVALPVLEEGFVLRFADELMVKVKGTAYLAAHRFISHLSDRNILEAVAEGTADNLAILAPEEYRQDVIDKIAHFNKRVVELEEMCYNLYREAPQNVPRKDFAAWVNANVPNYFKGFVFKLLDGQSINRKQMFKKLEEIDKIDGRTRI